LYANFWSDLPLGVQFVNFKLCDNHRCHSFVGIVLYTIIKVVHCSEIKQAL